VFRLVLLLLPLSLASASDKIIIPDPVQAVKHSVMTLCDEIHIHGKFSWDKGDELKEKYEVISPGCGVAFQISSTEVITAAHVLPEFESRLFKWLSHRHIMTSFHRFNHDHKIPIGDIRITYRRLLNTYEGEVISSATWELNESWNANPANQAEIDRLQAVFRENVTKMTERADFSVVAKDDALDLALIILAEPIERGSYVTLMDVKNELNESSWVVSSRRPSRFWDVTEPNYSIISGYVAEVDTKKRVEYAEVSDTARLDLLETMYPVVPGSSGSPVVDDNGILMGVASFASGNPFMLEMPRICDREYPNGFVDVCHAGIVSAEEVYDFLERVR
jgi:V8-like Glu-specific endopeptidase